VLKHWYKRDLMEMDIAISNQEAVALLRAVVDNSKTALMDAFKRWFVQEAHPLPPFETRIGSASVEKMQIFVRIFAGETITLDVASSDTVAAVRSKIQARKKLMDSCGG
uniref:Ubiquitin-like domain-containing protein n=2 Tax=Aegilops tauschii subsp. strangulata TaxID=200361 RepID=A0A453J6I9_AEGTS